MATPATARRSEPLSSSESASVTCNLDDCHHDVWAALGALEPALTHLAVELQADLEAKHSPLGATHHPSSRASTPRPSISPLSTFNRSPEAARDVAMGENAAQEDVEVDNTAAATAEVGELEDEDDRSSSLSEPEDEQETAENADASNQVVGDGDQLDAQRSLDVDSEAETDRLDQTPQKLRQHADSIGKTPSKLSRAATAEGELSEPPSPVPTAGPGAASSTSTIATTGELAYTPEALLGRSY